MIKKSTLIEMVILVTAAVILLMALLSFNVNAQELASAANIATNTTANAPSNNATMKKQMYHLGPAGNRLSGNYTSPLAFSNNNTLTKAQILQQRGVPGEGIDNAPGLRKPFNPKAAENAGIKKFLYRFSHIFQEMIQKRFPLSWDRG